MSQDNVIEVSFKQRSNFAKELENFLDLEDPIDQLLNEFEDEINDVKQDFIATEKLNCEDFKLSYSDPPMQMVDTLLEQIADVKDNMKRISYYLDEMNIE